jgi:Xaa-Pro aminopeptidase
MTGGVSADEHRDRQHRAREAAAERGLDALVAISRGGGTHDRVADVLWLAGLTTSQQFVADLAGHWRAAGHVFLVLPVAGPATAIVDAEDLQTAPVADEAVVAGDAIAAAATALADGLDGGRSTRVGVLGSDVLSAAHWSALEDLVRRRCPRARLEPADDLGLALRGIKSPAEQDLLRASCRLGSDAMAAGLEAAVPGVPESAVAAALVERVVSEGGAIYDVAVSSGPASATLGPSGGAAGAAAWTRRRLVAGDLLRVDAYGSVGGYLFDFARTVVVGGSPTGEQAELTEAVHGSVAAGIGGLSPGVRLAEVARRCEEALAASAHARRYGVPSHPMGGFWGHGLGLGFEPPWIGSESDGIVEGGMCLAIERRASVPGLGGAQHEDDVLVGRDGPELLT